MNEHTNKNTPNNTGSGNTTNTQRQSDPGQQPGTQRKGAENTQMGGDASTNAGKTDRTQDELNERQPGTARKGAEKTQMGAKNTGGYTEHSLGNSAEESDEVSDTVNEQRDERKSSTDSANKNDRR